MNSSHAKSPVAAVISFLSFTVLMAGVIYGAETLVPVPLLVPLTLATTTIGAVWWGWSWRRYAHGLTSRAVCGADDDALRTVPTGLAYGHRARIGDQERHQMLDVLAEHFGAGRLSADDHQARVDAALAAVTPADLVDLGSDRPPLAARRH